MKKILLLLPLLAFAIMLNATCYHVRGTIRTYKVYYDANKRMLYEEEQGSQYYERNIEARDMDEAKRQAMTECESMCYSADRMQEMRENGQVIGYYRLVRRTEITSCSQGYNCN